MAPKIFLAVKFPLQFAWIVIISIFDATLNTLVQVVLSLQNFWWIYLIAILAIIGAFLFNAVIATVWLVLWDLFSWVANMGISFIDVYRAFFSFLPGTVNTIHEAMELFGNTFITNLEDTLPHVWVYFQASLSFVSDAIFLSIDYIIAWASNIIDLFFGWVCEVGVIVNIPLCGASNGGSSYVYTQVYEYLEGDLLVAVTQAYSVFFMILNWFTMIAVPHIIQALMGVAALLMTLVQAASSFAPLVLKIIGMVLLSILRLFVGSIDGISGGDTGRFPTNATAIDTQAYLDDKIRFLSDTSLLDNFDFNVLLNRTTLDYIYGIYEHRNWWMMTNAGLIEMAKWVFENILLILTWADLKWCAIVHPLQCGRTLYLCELGFTYDGPIHLILSGIATTEDSTVVLVLQVLSSMLRKAPFNSGERGQNLADNIVDGLYAVCRASLISSGSCICLAYQANVSRPEDAPLIKYGTGGAIYNIKDAVDASLSLQGVPSYIPAGFALKKDSGLVYYDSICKYREGSDYDSLLYMFMDLTVDISKALENKPANCYFWSSITSAGTYSSHRILSYYDSLNNRWPVNNTFPMLISDPYMYYRQYYTVDYKQRNMANWLLITPLENDTGLIDSMMLNTGAAFYEKTMLNRLSHPSALRHYFNGDINIVRVNDYMMEGESSMQFIDETQKYFKSHYTENPMAITGLLIQSLLEGICYSPMYYKHTGYVLLDDQTNTSSTCTYKNRITGLFEEKACFNEIGVSLMEKTSLPAICPDSEKTFNDKSQSAALRRQLDTWMYETRQAMLRQQFADILVKHRTEIFWLFGPENIWMNEPPGKDEAGVRYSLPLWRMCTTGVISLSSTNKNAKPDVWWKMLYINMLSSNNDYGRESFEYLSGAYGWFTGAENVDPYDMESICNKADQLRSSKLNGNAAECTEFWGAANHYYMLLKAMDDIKFGVLGIFSSHISKVVLNVISIFDNDIITPEQWNSYYLACIFEHDLFQSNSWIPISICMDWRLYKKRTESYWAGLFTDSRNIIPTLPTAFIINTIENLHNRLKNLQLISDLDILNLLDGKKITQEQWIDWYDPYESIPYFYKGGTWMKLDQEFLLSIVRTQSSSAISSYCELHNIAQNPSAYNLQACAHNIGILGLIMPTRLSLPDDNDDNVKFKVDFMLGRGFSDFFHPDSMLGQERFIVNKMVHKNPTNQMYRRYITAAQVYKRKFPNTEQQRDGFRGIIYSLMHFLDGRPGSIDAPIDVLVDEYLQSSYFDEWPFEKPLNSTFKYTHLLTRHFVVAQFVREDLMRWIFDWIFFDAFAQNNLGLCEILGGFIDECKLVNMQSYIQPIVFDPTTNRYEMPVNAILAQFENEYVGEYDTPGTYAKLARYFYSRNATADESFLLALQDILNKTAKIVRTPGGLNGYYNNFVTTNWRNGLRQRCVNAQLNPSLCHVYTRDVMLAKIRDNPLNKTAVVEKYFMDYYPANLKSTILPALGEYKFPG